MYPISKHDQRSRFGSKVVLQPELKVIYIAGVGRSGSTLLDLTLGQLPGFFSTGTLLWIWSNGLIRNDLCGCGSRFADCQVWREVLEETFGTIDKIDVDRLNRLQSLYSTTKRFPRILKAKGELRPSAELQEFSGVLSKLYESIRKIVGCRVIVDSSKFPFYAKVLDQIPEVDMTLVHLVRDPRGVAFSWSQTREAEPGVVLPRWNPLQSSIYWIIRNDMIQRLWKSKRDRYQLLNYEWFVANPLFSVAQILQTAGEEAVLSEVIESDAVFLKKTHTIGGNSIRFNTGRISLKIDDSWQTQMSKWARFLVTAATYPWMRRYGYRVRGAHPLN